MSKRVVYRPPTSDVIYDCARQVCERLGKLHGPAYTEPDVVYGLSVFLQAVASMYATYLNEVSNQEEKFANSAD